MKKWKKLHLLTFFLVLSLTVSLPAYSQEATEEPTPVVTEEPTPIIIEEPTAVITEEPTQAPTEAPTEIVTVEPTVEIPVEVTPELTVEVPAEVTAEPTVEVTAEATLEATAEVTAEATAEATETVYGAATEERLLQYNPNASEDSIQAMLRALGAVELERIAQIGVLRVLMPAPVASLTSAQSAVQNNTAAVAAGLMNIEPNIIYRTQFSPNDTHFANGLQPQLEDETVAASIYMESAWDISPKDGQGVTVAVIDSGVDLQHPEFSGKLVAGWDFYFDDNNPDDDNGHGTHVAGIIGARTNNGAGIASIAYNAKIMPVKVCDTSGLSCPVYEIAAGMIFAVDKGAKVLNLSLGGPTNSTTIVGAVNYALARNVVVVAAAGNDGDGNAATDEIFYPASIPGVISVASVQSNGTIAGTSNSNSSVTVAAPGVGILSTWPLSGAPTSSFATGYEFKSGTSMASPHVAGLAALLIADNVATTPATVRDALMCGTLDMGTVGYDNSFGHGLIQADFSLTWRGNSSNCQATQANDLIQNATVITNSPFSITQAVNTRSVTESVGDPTISVTLPNQTLWYKFTPKTSGLYNFSTLGSSYDTLLGIYEGQPGSLREIIGNNDVHDPDGPSQVMASLTKGVTYYIQVGTDGPDVQGIMQLNVNPALTTSTLQQENVAAIRYTGTWNRVKQTGASGGYINTTTDTTATVSFLIRGTELKYTRVVGPNQSNVRIWIDNNVIVINGQGPVTQLQTINIALGIDSGQWHHVTILKNGSVGAFSLDAIQVSDGTLPPTVVTKRVNETATQFTNAFLGGAWNDGSATGAMSNNVKFTSDPGAYVRFRANGSAITFFRSTGAGTGQMEVYVDNELVETVDNSLLASHPSVPYTIPNLSPRERIVRVVHLGPGQLHFDGAQAITQAILGQTITDERSPHIAYTGIWTRAAAPGSQANTLSTMAASAGGGAAAFMFNGNHVCIGYQQNSSGGEANVVIDGTVVGTINSNGGVTFNKVEWCTFNVGLNQLTDTPHSVTLEVAAGQNFALDYVKPVRRTVFTPAMGYVTETNVGFIYNNAFGVWTTSTRKSTGGAKFQGGSAKQADINPVDGQRLTFHINGTGFILYTAIDVDGQAGAYEVYVDGVLFNNTFNDVVTPYIDLWEGRDFRFRPVGIGITGFAPGIHHIELRAITPFGGEYIYFDGIRVLP